jgi:hypothetical protein
MKRRFIPPFIIVYQMETEVPMESVSIEDAAKVLYAKDKLVTDLDMIERGGLTPKEYGIKKLGKRYKDARK